MEENVQRELDTLKGMLANWKTGYLSWATSDGDNDYVLTEFSEEIRNNIYPFVRRLFETDHLSEAEATEFMMYCFSQVEDLERQLKQAETDESKKEV